MIDIQNHIRNEGLLNLFDGRSRAPKLRAHEFSDHSDFCKGCGIGRGEWINAPRKSWVCPDPYLSNVRKVVRRVSPSFENGLLVIDELSDWSDEAKERRRAGDWDAC